MNKLVMKKAYAEVSEILKVIEDKYVNKIPMKLIDFFNNEKDKYHRKDIDFSLDDGIILDETLAIIAFLNLKYWVEDDEEHSKLIEIYKNNDITKGEVENQSTY